jgi:hypothetical protein
MAMVCAEVADYYATNLAAAKGKFVRMPREAVSKKKTCKKKTCAIICASSFGFRTGF